MLIVFTNGDGFWTHVAFSFHKFRLVCKFVVWKISAQNPSTTNNTQVPRYLLFCDGGILSAHALRSVGTKLISYMGKTL